MVHMLKFELKKKNLATLKITKVMITLLIIHL
jgi:hypothetical protein